MKNIPRTIFALVLILGIAGLREVSFAATINAASCSYSDVSAAVSAANREDTIIIPEGSVSWDNALTISKGIILKGAGIDKTIIMRSGNIIIYSPDLQAAENNEIFKITGFTFNGNGNTTPGMVILLNDSNCLITNIIVGENKFKNSNASAFKTGGMFNGVFYLNQLEDVRIVFGIFGLDDVSWSHRALSYGTIDNFYLEDNTIRFTQPGTPDVGWTESGQGGRVVVRYNTWDSANTAGSEYWDVHGLQSMPNCQQYSTMVAEYYGNMIINYSSAYRWMMHRGSWLMMFNNTVTGGTQDHLSIQIGQYSCDQCAYKGEGYVQHVNNTYVWNNTVNGNRADMYIEKSADYNADYCSINTYGFPKYTITQNIDYWNSNGSCNAANCPAGIGCGSAPPAGSCTPGTGYWLTQASQCSTPPATMAEMRRLTQAGRFYKCTAPDTWTVYYTPFTYPHPLRTPIDTTPPAAPTGLGVW